MSAAEKLARFLSGIPDGAVVEAGVEAAGVVQAAVRSAGRSIEVRTFPFGPDPYGDLHARWHGPAEGEQHEEWAWLDDDPAGA